MELPVLGEPESPVGREVIDSDPLSPHGGQRVALRCWAAARVSGLGSLAERWTEWAVRVGIHTREEPRRVCAEERQGWGDGIVGS